jgi:hypothetical protein
MIRRLARRLLSCQGEKKPGVWCVERVFAALQSIHYPRAQAELFKRVLRVGWGMVNELLVRARREAERVSAAVRVAARLRIARVESATDRPAARITLEMALEEISSLPRIDREAFLDQARRTAAAVAPALLPELGSGNGHLRRRFSAGTLVSIMLSHRHAEEATEFLFSYYDPSSFPFEFIGNVLEQVPDPQRRLRLVRSAIESWRNCAGARVSLAVQVAGDRMHELRPGFAARGLVSARVGRGAAAFPVTKSLAPASISVEMPRLQSCDSRFAEEGCMKSAAGVIACAVFLLNFTHGQVNPSPSLQPTPFEAFASLPATHIAWSKEVGRIDSREAHVVITALTLEDTAQPPDRMSGIRVDLSTRNIRDQVYLGEETLSVYKNALAQISTESARKRSQGTARDHLTPDGTSYLGAEVFWYAYNLPRVHTLDAAYYFAPDSSGLYLSAFKHEGFRFPDQDPAQLSAAIATAIDQLGSH